MISCHHIHSLNCLQFNYIEIIWLSFKFMIKVLDLVRNVWTHCWKTSCLFSNSKHTQKNHSDTQAMIQHFEKTVLKIRTIHCIFVFLFFPENVLKIFFFLWYRKKGVCQFTANEDTSLKNSALLEWPKFVTVLVRDSFLFFSFLSLYLTEMLIDG